MNTTVNWDPFGSTSLLGSEIAVSVIEIPKGKGSALDGEDYPEWFPVIGGMPLYRCGGCGELLSLHPDHTIADDGTVTASMFHNPDRGGCGWHVFGRLLDWTPT
jgi:hypothetical protein